MGLPPASASSWQFHPRTHPPPPPFPLVVPSPSNPARLPRRRRRCPPPASQTLSPWPTPPSPCRSIRRGSCVSPGRVRVCASVLVGSAHLKKEKEKITVFTKWRRGLRSVGLLSVKTKKQRTEEEGIYTYKHDYRIVIDTHLSSMGADASLTSGGKSKKARARAQAWSIT